MLRILQSCWTVSVLTVRVRSAFFPPKTKTQGIFRHRPDVPNTAPPDAVHVMQTEIKCSNSLNFSRVVRSITCINGLRPLRENQDEMVRVCGCERCESSPVLTQGLVFKNRLNALDLKSRARYGDILVSSKK